MNYREKAEAFKVLCRTYKREKVLSQETNVQMDDLLKRFVREDVEYVEKTFDKIEQAFGPEAKNILWKLFVDGRIQVDVAYESNISRRQLQYSVDRWIRYIFEDEE